MTKVVHCKREKYDVYIGRQYNVGIEHFGNPWSHNANANAILVETREIAVDNCRKWLNGEDFQNIEPDRRSWILSQIPKLKNNIRGCWCGNFDNESKNKNVCHGQVLMELLEKI